MTQRASAPEAPATAPAAPAAKRRPPAALMGILAVGLVVGGIFGVRWWAHRQAFVSTEDAQVASNLVTVSSRVPGKLAELLVDEGDEVKAGQVVAKLDDADFRAQLAQAQAALAVAQSTLGGGQTGVALQSDQTQAMITQAESALASARAQLNAALANESKAKNDRDRLVRLTEAGGAAPQTLEGARTALASAESGRQAAANQVRSAEAALKNAQAGEKGVQIKQAGVGTVRAQIKQAEAAVETARLMLEHATITAPVSGVVARRSANLGEQVAPGQGLFSVRQSDKLWVQAFIEETVIRRVQPGADVEVHVDAYPGETFKGKVSLVGAVTGSQFSLLPANNSAGNFTKVVQRLPVKVTVEDPKSELKPGMSAVIDISAK